MHVLSLTTMVCSKARPAITLVLLLAATGLTTAAANAASQDRYPLGSSPAAPIATMLGADGSLELPSDFSGSLDARGWRLVSNPDEPPRFAPVAAPYSHSGLSENPGSTNSRVAGDERWADGFGVGGLSGSAYAVAVDGTGNIYVGGEFKTAGNLVVNHIAKWDGASWSALGNGLNFDVWALAVDGSDNLYAGGDFTKACGDVNCSMGTTVNHVAKWDPSGAGTWSTLGNGLDSSVAAIAVDASNVFVGGSFMYACTPDCGTGTRMNRIAKWDLTAHTWSPLSLGLNGQVTALALDGNTLYVGGYFTGYCGREVCDSSYILFHVGTWNISEASWVSLGYGLGSSVNSLVVDSNHMLYAGGAFWNICTVAWCYTDTEANHVAKWDPSGEVWSAVGQGVDAQVRSMALDESGVLYVGGAFVNICIPDCTTGSAAMHLAKWDPSGSGSWSVVGTGTNGKVWGLTLVGPKSMYGVGTFQMVNGQVASNIFSMDTTSGALTGLGTGKGLSGTAANAIAADSNGNVYVGGSFTGAGGLVVNNIAMWSASSHTWTTLGHGVDDAVLALVVDADDNLYVGGAFQMVCASQECSTGTRVNNVAKWSPTGSSWSGVGNGVDSFVLALALDTSGNLYAGGLFQSVCNDQNCDGTSQVNHVARWSTSGGNWAPLASGLSNAVDAFAIDNSNRVYVGGDFDRVCDDLICAGGTQVNYIAVWEPGGTAHWSGMAKGFDSSVTALVLDGGNDLYAGGYFYNACTVDDCSTSTPVNLVAKWALGGTAWIPLQFGLDTTGYVASLVVDGSHNLYAGGYFGGICTSEDCTATNPVNRVVQWNPSGAGSWSALASGTDDGINGMARQGGELYVAGKFSLAGNKPSVRFGEYSFNSPPIVSDITKSGSIGTPVSFASADFSSAFTDPESETLAEIKVTSVPAAASGTLRLNSSTVTPNQEIALAEIGNLNFVPAAGWQGTTSFGWNGADANGYASSGAQVHITLTGSQLFLPLVLR